jgi:carbon monoxide dehydrogenase subunit G
MEEDMATIIKDFTVGAKPEAIWDALRDIGKIHERLARGFVTDTRMDGGDRIVTFANGLVVRERIVSMDDGTRRLAYSAASERLAHHNASFQVFPDGADGSRILWIADILPDAMADAIGAMMEDGSQAMRRTLEGEII